MKRTAKITDDGLYRYWLERSWEPKRVGMVWIMLNPSTADAENDDPTIRRCLDFSSAQTIGWMRVVNLFGYRATDPKELLKAKDPVGRDNISHIREAMMERGQVLVMVAWGNIPAKIWPLAARTITAIRSTEIPLYCLGTTKNGSPRHPLYVKGDAQPTHWRMA